jgi:hypothetical protein
MLDRQKQTAEMKNVRHLVDLIDGLKPESFHVGWMQNLVSASNTSFDAMNFESSGTKNRTPKPNPCTMRTAHVRV